MATTITNQATLQFTYGTTTATASSNIASTILQESLSGGKSALESAYQADGALTYIIQLTNAGAEALTNVTVTDNLGTYAATPTLSVTPLFYAGPAWLYLNGVFSAALTPEPVLNGIEFTIPSIPAGANALLVYKADVDDYALLAAGSEITNTATVTAVELTEPVTLTATVPVDAYADVRILKEMSPNPVTNGGTLTYTFTIQNSGNTAATNVVLTDTFSPAPNAIAVTVNGANVPATDYTYANGVLTLPGAGSAYTLSIPAATFEQSETTGEVTINPGTAVIVVTGTL